MTSNEYKEYYRKQLAAGVEFQDHVCEVLYGIGLPIVGYQSKKNQYKVGENITGIEIKFDDIYARTRNLWIEVAEKSNPENKKYVPSGIYRDDNSWLYVIGNYAEMFIFSHTMLRGVRGKYDERENDTKTSCGFLMPRNDAISYAAKVIPPVDEPRKGITSRDGYVFDMQLRKLVPWGEAKQ